MGMRFLDSRAILSIEEKLGCGFWRRDVGADEMEWSRGLFRLYGLDPAKDRPSYTLMRGTQHPEDRLTFDKIDGNVRAGTLFDRQYRVVLPCGSTRNLAHRGEVIFDSRGNPAFDVAVVWNVDERTQMLDEVLADERRIKVILEALDYFIAFLRNDGLAAPSPLRSYGCLETSGFAADRVQRCKRAPARLLLNLSRDGAEATAADDEAREAGRPFRTIPLKSRAKQKMIASTIPHIN